MMRAVDAMIEVKEAVDESVGMVGARCERQAEWRDDVTRRLVTFT
jgi:hypothetical protein